MFAHHTIGVLSPFVEGDYFSLLLKGIREGVRSHNVQLIAFQGTPSDIRAAHLARDRVAGWIAVVEGEHLQDIAPPGTPVVAVAAIPPGNAYPAVVTDNYGSMHAAIAHLYGHGHRRIAFVGPLGQLDFRQRHEGYRAALAAHHLPFDPGLLYVVDDNEELGGRHAAQRMLAEHSPCTAVVTATDEIAIGLMEVLQPAGRRIPADVAIVSFDDIDRAQYTSPALTTIHQHPDTLGRTAAEILLRQIAGHTPAPAVTIVPTTLIPRRSCGCPGVPNLPAHEQDARPPRDWQEAMIWRLARLVRAPLPLDTATPPAVLWPGAAALSHGLAAALSGADLPADSAIDQAWQQAVALTPDLEALDAIFQELAQAATQQMASLPIGSPVAARVGIFLDSVRRSLLRASLRRERAKLHYFQNTVQHNYAISLRLLGAEMSSATALAWLEQTGVTSSTLALWAEPPSGQAHAPAALVLAGRYDRAVMPAPVGEERYSAATYPPDSILPPSAHAGGADCTLVLPIQAADHAWGLLTICAPFAEPFAVENIYIWASLLAAALERAALLTSLTAQQSALRDQQEILRAAYERERKLVENIRLSEERYALAARAANDGLWDWDLVANTIYYSPRWKALLGIDDSAVDTSPEAWLGRVHPEDRPRLEQAIADHRAGVTETLEYEHRLRNSQGAYRWMLCRGLAVHNDAYGTFRMVGSLTDITDRKQLEERLRHDALYDGLTGLPNRALFLERLERVIGHAGQAPAGGSGVLFLDLDGFKVVNDSLGHLIGDQLLVGVAQRLTAALRAEDTAARFGGDEFAILVHNLHDASDLPALVDRLQAQLAAPFELEGHEIVVTASIGIATNLAQYQRAADVLRDADIAMYRAKAAGKRTYALFDADMHAGAVNRLRVETELRRAIEQREFELHYQPIVDLATSRIIQLEALIRWRHPERGLLAPAAFLPIAEDAGLSVAVGQWTFGEVCRQIRAWQAVLPAHIRARVSVNLSHKHFWHRGLMEHITSALRASDLEPSVLCLEITEGVIMRNPEAASRILRQVHDLGMHVHIDDFGTGYSSLEALHRFPIEALKIDRSFVARVGVDRRSAELVRTMIVMGQNLGLEVIAEGVETREQQRFLQQQGCRYAQGFLFAYPLPADAMRALLARRV